ncbi:hypothetical protein niasHS_005275 [Heterodera schachtii]|uniref:Uncharacterized protein n=1 Tax=Heterodera schachtii TaxID=97005 RepID=A0ABD2J8W2_HETSC
MSNFSPSKPLATIAPISRGHTDTPPGPELYDTFGNGGFDSSGEEPGAFGTLPPRQSRPLGPPLYGTGRRQPSVRLRSASPVLNSDDSNRADRVLDRRAGVGWWWSDFGRQRAEDELRRGLLRQLRNGQVVFWHQIDSISACSRLVRPNCTVADHWRASGRPLTRPELPALAQRRGIRGTSLRSRELRARNGFPPWNCGQTHKDFFPLESLQFVSLRSPTSVRAPRSRSPSQYSLTPLSPNPGKKRQLSDSLFTSDLKK